MNRAATAGTVPAGVGELLAMVAVESGHPIAPQLLDKARQLIDWFVPWPSCAVAFSAGIDSTLVALVASRVLGPAAMAVTADSPSLPRFELDAACQLAAQLGLQHRVLSTRELDRDGYRANAGNRCYYCKDELYTQLNNQLPELLATHEVAVIVNGANCDDLGDHRPGMVAAQEHRVRSPLIECGFTKSDVRQLAERWGIPTWDKPAAPCLASRVAYGVEVTAERLAMIEQGETYLRSMGLREFRLRLHADQLARIEVPLDEIPRLADPAVRQPLVDHLLQLGFRYVTLDLQGFRSGNLNQLVQLVVPPTGP
ncbi:MAG: ATP-dependent sacrificial sulfur transferase LarE [Pirellulales bacterium]